MKLIIFSFLQIVHSIVQSTKLSFLHVFVLLMVHIKSSGLVGPNTAHKLNVQSTLGRPSHAELND